jgi:hypothetical protein
MMSIFTKIQKDTTQTEQLKKILNTLSNKYKNDFIQYDNIQLTKNQRSLVSSYFAGKQHCIVYILSCL